MELTDELRDAFRAVVTARLALWRSLSELEDITGTDWCATDFDEICITVDNAADVDDTDMELLIKDTAQE